MPKQRVRSAIGIPSSTRFNAVTICSTEKRFLFTTNSFASTRGSLPEKLTPKAVRITHSGSCLRKTRSSW